MLSAFKKAFFGNVTKEENKNLPDVNKTELVALIPLVAITIWLGVYPKPVLDPINKSVTRLVKFMHEKSRTPDGKIRIQDPLKVKTKKVCSDCASCKEGE